MGFFTVGGQQIFIATSPSEASYYRSLSTQQQHQLSTYQPYGGSYYRTQPTPQEQSMNMSLAEQSVTYENPVVLQQKQSEIAENVSPLAKGPISPAPQSTYAGGPVPVYATGYEPQLMRILSNAPAQPGYGQTASMVGQRELNIPQSTSALNQPSTTRTDIGLWASRETEISHYGAYDPRPMFFGETSLSSQGQARRLELAGTKNSFFSFTGYAALGTAESTLGGIKYLFEEPVESVKQTALFAGTAALLGGPVALLGFSTPGVSKLGKSLKMAQFSEGGYAAGELISGAGMYSVGSKLLGAFVPKVERIEVKTEPPKPIQPGLFTLKTGSSFELPSPEARAAQAMTRANAKPVVIRQAEVIYSGYKVTEPTVVSAIRKGLFDMGKIVRGNEPFVFEVSKYPSEVKLKLNEYMPSSAYIGNRMVKTAGGNVLFKGTVLETQTGEVSHVFSQELGDVFKIQKIKGPETSALASVGGKPEPSKFSGGGGAGGGAAIGGSGGSGGGRGMGKASLLELAKNNPNYMKPEDVAMNIKLNELFTKPEFSGIPLTIVRSTNTNIEFGRKGRLKIGNENLFISSEVLARMAKVTSGQSRSLIVGLATRFSLTQNTSSKVSYSTRLGSQMAVNLKTASLSGLKLANILGSSTVTSTANKTQLGSAVISATATKTQLENVTAQKIGTRTGTASLKDIEIKTPVNLPSSKRRRDESSFKRLKQLYAVYLRRHGVFQQVGGLYGKGKALDVGQRAAKESIAATFRIAPKALALVEDAFESQGHISKEFYKPKSPALQDVAGSITRTQLRGTRLGTRAERAQIQAARKQPSWLKPFMIKRK